ncbi:MAG: hypothetical protein WCW13_05055 [archaeon]
MELETYYKATKFIVTGLLGLSLLPLIYLFFIFFYLNIFGGSEGGGFAVGVFGIIYIIAILPISLVSFVTLLLLQDKKKSATYLGIIWCSVQAILSLIFIIIGLGPGGHRTFEYPFDYACILFGISIVVGFFMFKSLQYLKSLPKETTPIIIQ